MREIVFLGEPEQVLKAKEEAILRMAELLDQLQLAGEIRTASDPFFVSEDSLARTFFQLTSETKFEVSLFLSPEERTAAGSFNNHGDFFCRAFDIRLPSERLAHTACVAFGLERWVLAFLSHHGPDVKEWPTQVREALISPESKQ